ncbi:MAG: phosphate signaling complex protein PhoU [Deltaproteobacteria bacterium]|nr:phosphate signaling complex protein PhoU [Deltaproteobacteria bacterium]
MAHNIQTEIETLKGHIVYLSTVVEENMQCAIKALIEKNSDLAYQVMQTDRCEVDHIETDVEQECLRIMALHQPVASDLRFLVTALKVNSDLERIGDLVAKIADKVLLLYKADPVKFLSDSMQIPEMFNGMFDKTVWMFKQAMEAFVNEDTDLAYKVCLADDEVDQAKRTIYSELEESIMSDPAQHVYLAKLLSVARSTERIADHCTNICEDIIYMAQGRIVRHNH